MKSVFSQASLEISERHRQITIFWQSLPILSKILILIPLTIIILFLFALTFFIILTSVFVIPGIFLFVRWVSIFAIDNFNTGDMKVPTFYSTKQYGSELPNIFLMSVAGAVFGGIHCAGWFFNFPSNDEAMLWRVSSTVLTGIAFLLPLLVYLFMETSNMNSRLLEQFVVAVFIIILLAYVVSRLLLLVEAFISLRFLAPGMLALVKWTSFIPHV